jgi:diguanylate cyclase (GGDEF)-like protein
VCVPIAVFGRAAGVIHVTGAVDDPPGPEHVQQMALLGAGVGSRLGMIRNLRDSAVAASTDPLTGLLNRRSLEVKMTPLERGVRSYAVIALDLDHFKLLNDTHGHLTGDQALRLFSRVLRSTARDGDLVARFGGEEFLVVLPDTGEVDAAQLAERVRLELAHALAEGAVPQFTVSAGVADSHETDTFEEAALLADQRLYKAKAGGRNRVESAPQSTTRAARDAVVPVGSGSTAEAPADGGQVSPAETR